MPSHASPSLNNRLYIRIVTQLNDLTRLRHDWDNLASKQGGYKPFLSFDWYWLWLNHFCEDDQLCIVVLYEDSDIACVAPFLRRREKFRGIGVLKIELIGNVYSPFRYFLFNQRDDEHRIRALCMIFEFLSKSYSYWDFMDLYPVPEENMCFDLLRDALETTQLTFSDYVAFGDWYLDRIECSGDQYIHQLPKKIRKDVAYCQRRLQKTGNLEFRMIRDEDLIDNYMDLYYQIYSKSWQKREEVGPAFHRDLAKMAATRGWLRLGFLFFNQAPISSQFWITCNKTSYILKTIYDLDYRKYSPGKILTAEMMKYVIDIDKVRVVDYVQGDEPYKKDWTPKRRDRKGFLVFNNNYKGRYLALISKKVQPAFNEYKYLQTVKRMIRSLLR
jgi:CelD/BcsL family acetyltransferase involved in cellulose biosynthesis